MREKANDRLFSGAPVATDDLDRWIPGPEAAEAAGRGDLDWYQSHVCLPCQSSIEYLCRIVEQYGDRKLIDPNIILGTVHSVKGGEADVVVLLPDLTKAAYRDYTSPDPEQQDAIWRMMYVGITRAKEAFYMAAPGGRRHLPMDLI
jgi:hypothetical protein